LFLECSKNIGQWLKICTSYLVYSQTSLNLPRDDHHFFYMFLWMITMTINKNSLRKILHVNTNFIFHHGFFDIIINKIIMAHDTNVRYIYFVNYAFWFVVSTSTSIRFMPSLCWLMVWIFCYSLKNGKLQPIEQRKKKPFKIKTIKNPKCNLHIEKP